MKMEREWAPCSGANWPVETEYPTGKVAGNVEEEQEKKVEEEKGEDLDR